MYRPSWLPPFQPIVGHWWLLKHVPAKHDWITAEKDAPWHTYTTLRLDIKDVYAGARTDWWLLDHLDGNRKNGLTLLALMALMALLSIGLLVRALRGDRVGPALPS
jgi:hypothetical protein